jgi:hypothetical protein
VISTRYTAVVAILFATALVPTVIHSYRDGTRPDGLRAAALTVPLDGQTGTPTKRRANWGQDRFSSNDWLDRQYPGGLTLFVGRSFDAKKLYHHPELALAYGQSYGPAAVTRLPLRPDIPVHVLRGTDTNVRRVALYALAYEGAYVADPIRFQLRMSIEQVFSARKAMTLFFVTGQLPPAETGLESSAAARLLLEAVQEFERQTPRTGTRP